MVSAIEATLSDCDELLSKFGCNLNFYPSNKVPRERTEMEEKLRAAQASSRRETEARSAAAAALVVKEGELADLTALRAAVEARPCWRIVCSYTFASYLGATGPPIGCPPNAITLNSLSDTKLSIG